MRVATLALVLLLCSTTYGFTLTRTELEQQLLSIQVLRAKYHQTRHVSGLAAPLESSGRLLMAKDTGLVWKQEKPFPAEFVFTESTVSETLPGQPQKVKPRTEQADIFKLVSMITELLQGKTSSLEKIFDTNFKEETDDRWSLVLMPKDSRIRKAFSSITLSGGSLIESMEIIEKSSNKSVIEFLDQSTSPPALTSDETRYFQN